jgi:Fic family protein
MTWNWQLKDWPNFTHDIRALENFERALLLASGSFLGVFKCLDAQEQETLKISLLSDEALNTSAIEGVYLHRDSLQASLRKEFGFMAEVQKFSPAEKGIAQVMRDVYTHYAEPLNHDKLFTWSKWITHHGAYRSHSEPMLIVSGGYGEPTIHFEAPPSDQVLRLMDEFINWFNQTAPNGDNPLPILSRAGIAHAYFESIHPFEDGNGRIGRALAEKALSQGIGFPALIALSTELARIFFSNCA